MTHKDINTYFNITIKPIWNKFDAPTKNIIEKLITTIKELNSANQNKIVYFLDSDKKQWDIAIKTLYSYEDDTPTKYKEQNKKIYNYLKKLPLIYNCIEDDKLGNYLSCKKDELVKLAREKSLITEKLKAGTLDDFYKKLYKDSK